MAVYTDAGLQETWARAVSAHWMYHVTQFSVNGGKKEKKRKKLKIITHRAAMVYKPVNH